MKSPWPEIAPEHKNHENMAAMFNNIAVTYDKVNKQTSFGFDKRWRKNLIDELAKSGAKSILDLACGTGVLTWEIYKKLPSKILGADLAPEMLKIAEQKRSRIKQSPLLPSPVFVQACAEALPFLDSSFDAVTIAFGIRNFQDRKASLEEIQRVLHSGGMLFILEFASPRNALWRTLFVTYFRYILPLWGKIYSGNMAAYRYLPASVANFPQYEEFCKELSNAGYRNSRYRSYTGGVALLYTAQKDQ